jgi:hypothetical protein
MMTGPMASPSRPSVRLTALEVPTTTNIPNTRYSATGSTKWCFVNAAKGSASDCRWSSQSVGRNGPLP